MLILLSPAKSLNTDPSEVKEFSLPALQDQALPLVNLLKRKSVKSVKEMMKVSDSIAKLNAVRFKSYQAEHTLKNAKQALFTFDGDVYKGMEPSSFTKTNLKFCQKHLRILSGLYGILKPMDLIQPYRLEMGSKLKNRRGTNLYAYWGSQITEILNRDLEAHKSNLVINLASKEYFKAIKLKELNGEVLNINFKEFRNGKYVFVSFSAKRARGMMAKYIIKNKIKSAKDILTFDMDNYQFNADLSSDKEYIFTK